MLRAFEFSVRVLMCRLRIAAGIMFVGVIVRMHVGVAVLVRVDQITVPVLVAVAVLMGMTVAIDMPMGVAAVMIVHRKRLLNRFALPRAVENAA
jgi:hypothetical protein